MTFVMHYEHDISFAGNHLIDRDYCYIERMIPVHFSDSNREKDNFVFTADGLPLTGITHPTLHPVNPAHPVIRSIVPQKCVGSRFKNWPLPSSPTNAPSRTATSPRTVTHSGRPICSQPSNAL
ncbi:hypothetical protein Pla175_14180 [Pirellulimonas nuda]|uniref:Uncharacterized protein n=1 Tax=Pirellulimonas nuda TaxID=2528009 RepID=A0A518D991_9BACT|nr:hypothetical protein Pla175_14180 [Pirellulimonas nuda]